MNLLTEQLPSAVEISGIETPIETDFRAALRVILAFEDESLTPTEQATLLLSNLYPTRPPDLKRAIEQGLKYLNGGSSSEPDSEPRPRLYSFEQDAPLIFAAFRQTHGIDLETAELHWWKFLALFMDLGTETTFCQLVSLRKRVKSGRASKEELRAYREMGEVATLPEPDRRSVEERERPAHRQHHQPPVRLL